MAKSKLLALLSSSHNFRHPFVVPLLSLFWEVEEITQRRNLIPWQEIWTPLCEAKRHGNLGITQVFLDALFEQAVFDDRGVWSRVK